MIHNIFELGGVWGVPDRARANWNAWYGGSGRIPSHISSSLQGLVAFRILLPRPWDVRKPCPCFHQHATSSPGIASISCLLTRPLAVRTSFRSLVCGLSAGRRKQLRRPLRQPWWRLRQEQQGQRQQLERQRRRRYERQSWQQQQRGWPFSALLLAAAPLAAASEAAMAMRQ